MKVCGLIIAAATCVTLHAQSAFAEDGIHCSEIATAYNDLILADGKRSKDTVAQMKSLSAKQLEKEKDALAKKECSIGGEMIGLYNVMQTQLAACAANGEKLGAFPDEVKVQLKGLREAMTGLCG